MSQDREKKLVDKNDGSLEPDEILATTYQMRNFYKQMSDGWINHLHVMNYIQHVVCADRAPTEGRVLDVCCGRSLMLPLLRYRADGIDEYVGVEIEEKNLSPLDTRVTDGTSISDNPRLPDSHEEYYPFDITYHVTDAAEMDSHIEEDSIDYAIYTSSIEHMHKEHGERSLDALANVMRPGSQLILSCPNTPEGQDGYDVRYKAHVYEWKLSELREALEDRGFIVREEYGLTGDLSDLPDTEPYNTITSLLPSEFARPALFAPYPELSSEVLMVAECRQSGKASAADW